jgi:hypothetical protein
VEARGVFLVRKPEALLKLDTASAEPRKGRIGPMLARPPQRYPIGHAGARLSITRFDQPA